MAVEVCVRLSEDSTILSGAALLSELKDRVTLCVCWQVNPGPFPSAQEQDWGAA